MGKSWFEPRIASINLYRFKFSCRLCRGIGRVSRHDCCHFYLPAFARHSCIDCQDMDGITLLVPRSLHLLGLGSQHLTWFLVSCCDKGFNDTLMAERSSLSPSHI